MGSFFQNIFLPLDFDDVTCSSWLPCTTPASEIELDKPKSLARESPEVLDVLEVLAFRNRVSDVSCPLLTFRSCCLKKSREKVDIVF